MKEQLLAWIEQDRERLISFRSDFIRTPSPNPPGDTPFNMGTYDEHVLANEFLNTVRVHTLAAYDYLCTGS